MLIGCKTSDVDRAARFWGEALGRAVDPNDPHTAATTECRRPRPTSLWSRSSAWTTASRLHIDIETYDIPAEVARLEQLGATVVSRLQRWVVMEAPTRQRFCVVRVQGPGFPNNANRWD